MPRRGREELSLEVLGKAEHCLASSSPLACACGAGMQLTGSPFLTVLYGVLVHLVAGSSWVAISAFSPEHGHLLQKTLFGGWRARPYWDSVLREDRCVPSVSQESGIGVILCCNLRGSILTQGWGSDCWSPKKSSREPASLVARPGRALALC